MSFRRFIKTLILITITLSLLPLNVFAELKPWDSYKQFIPDNTPIVKRHLRGAWVSTVLNLDWPSLKAMDTVNNDERIQKSKNELTAILDKAADMNMNAVFFQVSPEGDAFYKSSLVPWSRYLTGTFGKEPGFDPLAFAIEEAHKRNLEIHAWFNPYRVSMNTKDATIASLNINKSVYKEHPQWIKSSASRFVVDPGIPEARKWVIDRVMEVVGNYDIDGIHFDDYFYYESYKGELKDQDTFKKYNNGQFTNIDDWRRNNTYLLIKELSKRIRGKKPWVKFGISPAGVWGNKSDGHPDGSNTRSSFTNYDRCFADTKKWVTEELIDYIAPQVYFSFANPAAPYGEVSSWWSNVCKGKKVHLYIGQAIYKVNNDSDEYFKGLNAIAEFTRQLKFNLSKPEIKGSILFRMKNLNDSEKQQVVNSVRNELWSTKALMPIMSWKGEKSPASPTLGKISVVSNGANISWTNTDPKTTYFAIYRFTNGDKGDISSNSSAKNLIATMRINSNARQEFIDTNTPDLNNTFYVITALDRLHNESAGLKISKSLSDNFNDISLKYTWAIKEIDNLFKKGIVKGDGAGKFNPGQNTKRCDFILMIVRALNLKSEFNDNFTDVPKNAYYYDAIGIAKALDIAKGSGDNFNPNGNITREDMMVIVVRALEASGIKLEKAGEDYLSNYSDRNLISNYAKEAAASLTKLKLVQGSGGLINPKGMATRAEIAVILFRVLNWINPV